MLAIPTYEKQQMESPFPPLSIAASFSKENKYWAATSTSLSDVLTSRKYWARLHAKKWEKEQKTIWESLNWKKSQAVQLWTVREQSLY